MYASLSLETFFSTSRTFGLISVTALVTDAGLRATVCVPSLKFVGLPVRKIYDIYCVSINRPCDLDLWSLIIAQILYFSDFWHHHQIAAIKSRQYLHFHQNWRQNIFSVDFGSKPPWFQNSLKNFGLQFWWKYKHRQLTARAIRRWCLFERTARIYAMVKGQMSRSPGRLILTQ